MNTQTKKEFDIMLGKNLRYIRKQKRMTQTQVALELKVTFQQIQKYEKGTNGVSGYKLKQYCDLFDVSIKMLIDPNFITIKEAIKEVKDLNNGEVKHKDFMNTYTEILNAENNS